MPPRPRLTTSPEQRELAPNQPAAGQAKCMAKSDALGVFCERTEHPPDEDHTAEGGAKSWRDGAAPSESRESSSPQTEAPRPPPPEALRCAFCAAAPTSNEELISHVATAHADKLKRGSDIPPPAAARPALRPAAAPAPARAAVQQVGQAASKRMVLANVKEGPLDEPYKVLLYGVEGIGKSSWGADAPSPIFLPGEKSPNITAPKFPQPECWQDVVDAVTELGTQEHSYKTLVIDTVDRLEPLAWTKVIADDNQGNQKRKARTIEDVGGGYGKGYLAALDPWRQLLQRLERLQAAKHMHVVFIAHSQVKTFRNPEGEDYDRWEMAVHQKLSGLLRWWTDCNLFTNYRTRVQTDRRGRSLRKGESDGGRLIYTARHAAYDAKNRYGLPSDLSLDWFEFDRLVQENRTPEALRGFIAEKLDVLRPIPDEAHVVQWVEGELSRTGIQTQRLVRINNKLAARLEEMDRAAEENTDDGGAAA